MSLSKLQEIVKDGEAWHFAVFWIAKSQLNNNDHLPPRPRSWTTSIFLPELWSEESRKGPRLPLPP